MIIDEGHIIKNVLDNSTGVQRIIKKVYIEDTLVFNSPLGSLEDRSTYMNDNTQNVIDRGEKLLLTPTAWSVGAVHSALPKDGSGDFTFSRNSSATYIEDGIIKTALPNLPRIQDGKILIEGQATNLASNSSSFPNTNNESLTTTSNIPNDYAPWNSTLRETLINGENLGLSAFLAVNAGSALANETKASFSLILEKVNGDFVHYVFSLIGVNFNFDFSIGEITGSSNIVKNKITEVNAGVFLVDIVAEFTPTTSTFVQLRGGNTTSGTETLSEIGSHKISYYGYQVDTDDFIGIIPTSGGVATRLADIATVTPPAGVTQIIETIKGVEQSPITVIPPTYQLPVGNIDKVKMI